MTFQYKVVNTKYAKNNKTPKNYHKFSIIHEVSNLIPVNYNKK